MMWISVGMKSMNYFLTAFSTFPGVKSWRNSSGIIIGVAFLKFDCTVAFLKMFVVLTHPQMFFVSGLSPSLERNFFVERC